MFKKLLGKFINDNKAVPASLVPLYAIKAEGFAFPLVLPTRRITGLSLHAWNNSMKRIMYHTGRIAGLSVGMTSIAF